MAASEAEGPWARVHLALTLLAVDPAGLKGLWLRARAGPLRDRVTDGLAALPLPLRRLHPGIGDDALYGGLDLAATLASGRATLTHGLLAEDAALVLTMAERCGAGLAARLAGALDRPGHCLVALDEAAGDDEGLPSALSDRLALFLSLDDLSYSETAPLVLDAPRIAAARERLAQVRVPKTAAVSLTRAAAGLGIDSLRAPLLALRLARAAAAFRGHRGLHRDDLVTAADLVFGHRALPIADAPGPPPAEEPPDTPPDATEAPPAEGTGIPEEVLVEAARAALPHGLLQALAAGRAARAAKGASGTGGARSGNRRGRPLPSRAGRLGTGARIDLVATLRAAAPWQPLRRRQADRADAVLLIRPGDIRLKRFVETSDRVLIFAVDASGSSAFARLAEAKGAVELLLAEAYARRDHVALIAFRGTEAELVLPPTRSLVQTKRRLQGLPGGGGTPLAAALRLGLATAVQARGRGLTPSLAILTDGRGNIALDGSANRERAEADALAFAQAIRAGGIPAVVIDTGTRPQPGLAALARAMDAPYLALPRADAHRLAAALDTALGA